MLDFEKSFAPFFELSFFLWVLRLLSSLRFRCINLGTKVNKMFAISLICFQDIMFVISFLTLVRLLFYPIISLLWGLRCCIWSILFSGFVLLGCMALLWVGLPSRRKNNCVCYFSKLSTRLVFQLASSHETSSLWKPFMCPLLPVVQLLCTSNSKQDLSILTFESHAW
jgi:hypothetical protein